MHLRPGSPAGFRVFHNRDCRQAPRCLRNETSGDKQNKNKRSRRPDEREPRSTLSSTRSSMRTDIVTIGSANMNKSRSYRSCMGPIDFCFILRRMMGVAD
mmetsp:Transcript_13373/g.37654  ORF Transcript_13373/g.37654 Transcript_13373/m.37654 type:complete len:100 (-) Transcript_13373:2040-2339(-)